MVSLDFVKNDSYEKGPDAVVVHVYVKEIRREAARVLFREQDFTLVFQTRCVGAGRPRAAGGTRPHSLPRPQGRQLPAAAPGLRAPHRLPLAGEAQVGGARPARASLPGSRPGPAPGPPSRPA